MDKASVWMVQFAWRQDEEGVVMSVRDCAPNQSAGPCPVRSTHSVRRTSTIDTHWPEGRDGPMSMRGDARDIFTGASLTEQKVLSTASFDILASGAREILSIESSPALPNRASLEGVRAGGQSRKATSSQVSIMNAEHSPLHLLLDDFAGASLVAGWAWSRWMDGDLTTPDKNNTALPRMEGICAGFRPGASSLDSEGRPLQSIQSSAFVESIINPADWGGWHSVRRQEGVAMRRARWMEVRRVERLFEVSSGFQDSATDPSGRRVAVHEYRLNAKIDCETSILTEVNADPRILPYRECPAAAANIGRLMGVSVEELRREVLDRLPGTLGCTHLNDMLRSLADIPRLTVML